MKLWAMRQAGLIDSYKFDLDLHAEVYEACAYHRWGLFDNPPNALATLILGGGVPKNLQSAAGACARARCSASRMCAATISTSRL